MKSKFDKIEVDIYGESHSDKIAVRMSGIPACERVDLVKLAQFMDRRKSAKNAWSTPRHENDEVTVESGIENGLTTGGDILAVIENNNIRKSDYNEVQKKPRPSHADYVSFLRDGSIATGGGRFSGRMTAPLCVAGAIALDLLEKRNVEIYAYISGIGGVPCGSYSDSSLLNSTSDNRNIGLLNSTADNFKILDVITETAVDMLKNKAKACKFDQLPLFDNTNRHKIEQSLKDAALDGDSLGGVIECIVFGLCAGGLGDAMFDGLDGKIAQSIFAVPAVRGVEFGDGFAIAHMKGSEANDAFCIDNDKIRDATTKDNAVVSTTIKDVNKIDVCKMNQVNAVVSTLTNHSGGINGGISNGMPVTIRVAIRPTPSISKVQNTVDLENHKNTKIEIVGRHDVCIVPRAVPCVESAVALAILDEMILRNVF